MIDSSTIPSNVCLLQDVDASVYILGCKLPGRRISRREATMPDTSTREPSARRLPRTQRREQIIAAATRAFARAGFAATNLDDIAAEAGISRAILYRHFDSKTDLYQAVLDSACGRVIAATG